MDQPSVYVFRGSRMTDRLALIRVRSRRCGPGEWIGGRSTVRRPRAGGQERDSNGGARSGARHEEASW